MAFDDWNAIVEKQIAELSLVRSWAAQTGYGTVRDHISRAIHDLRQHEEIRKRHVDAFIANTEKRNGTKHST